MNEFSDIASIESIPWICRRTMADPDLTTAEPVPTNAERDLTTAEARLSVAKSIPTTADLHLATAESIPTTTNRVPTVAKRVPTAADLIPRTAEPIPTLFSFLQTTVEVLFDTAPSSTNLTLPLRACDFTSPANILQNYFHLPIDYIRQM